MEKTILVVDDFEVNTYVVGHTLTKAGYKVLKAQSGEEALKIAAETKINLLITDYKMPKMDGVELIKQIKKMPQYRFIPVLVLTTETEEEKKRKAREIGITGWIQKPFELTSFLETVKKALR